ncbi:MAG: DNA recombination protein RmuC, partial [Eudoraea sp.]|nr:DNA recombination protein RmuC [Eudoraea sp.]
MNIYLIYLVIGLVFLAIGYFLGNYIKSLKTKSSQSTLVEERRQLGLSKKEMENRVIGLENEKEELRAEKEELGHEIVRQKA